MTQDSHERKCRKCGIPDDESRDFTKPCSMTEATHEWSDPAPYEKECGCGCDKPSVDCTCTPINCEHFHARLNNLPEEKEWWMEGFDDQYTSMGYGEKWRPDMEFTPSMLKAFISQTLKESNRRMAEKYKKILQYHAECVQDTLDGMKPEEARNRLQAKMWTLRMRKLLKTTNEYGTTNTTKRIVGI